MLHVALMCVCVCVCVCLPKLPNGRESNQMLIGGALPLAVCGESVVCLCSGQKRLLILVRIISKIVARFLTIDVRSTWSLVVLQPHRHYPLHRYPHYPMMLLPLAPFVPSAPLGHPFPHLP